MKWPITFKFFSRSPSVDDATTHHIRQIIQEEKDKLIEGVRSQLKAEILGEIRPQIKVIQGNVAELKAKNEGQVATISKMTQQISTLTAAQREMTQTIFRLSSGSYQAGATSRDLHKGVAARALITIQGNASKDNSDTGIGLPPP